MIEIKDSIYRGREDFVYRITVGELPFVTSVFPLGGPAGTPPKVELKGWNLPTNQYLDNYACRLPSPCDAGAGRGPGRGGPINH